jgi:hypothetical protein
MKTPNKYVSIVFVLALSYGSYVLVTSTSKGNFVSKPKESTQSMSATCPSGDGAHASPAIKAPSGDDFSARQARGKLLTWSRDPFLFPRGVEPYNKVEKAEKEETPSTLRVNAVLISGRQKVATVNCAPYVVSIGDWIEDEQVLEIEPDHVVLAQNGRKRELLLESLKVAPPAQIRTIGQ